MKRTLLPLLPLLLAALCVSGCRELVSPAGSYIVVESILSPVRIQTRDLEGSGWIQALMPETKEWVPFFVQPSGAFLFNEPLPFNVWHCDPSNGSDGCVAQIRAGDEKGFLATGQPLGSIYVCTADYVQKVGRKHCGKRMFKSFNPFDPNAPQPTVRLYSAATHGVNSYEFPNDGLYAWHGDAMSRLFSGASSFPDAESYDPPIEDGTPGRWNEYPYVPGEPAIISALSSNVSTDIGACSIFFPYEWENRLDDFWTPQFAELTANRGFAEMFIDGILEDPPAPTVQIEENVFFWADATAIIRQRTDVSPEFHFRVTNGISPNPSNDLIPQICFKNYMTASNDLFTGIDAWYRWDQGFLSGLASLFNIGTCKRKPVSLQYCGNIRMLNGKGHFDVAPDVALGMEEYSVFKPACRNTFRTKLFAGLKDGARTAGRENISEGVDKLVQAFQGKVRDILDAPDFTIRELNLTPTGIYIVTAVSTYDPQFAYRIGNCVGDLNTPKLNPVTQPQITTKYTNRGITRPIP